LCNGSSFCVHNKWKRLCKICDGKSLCKSSFCEKNGIPKYNGYCLTCCIHLFPEIKVSCNYKTKEKEVVDRIIAEFPNFTWVADKRIQDGCYKRRPDLLLDMGTHIIIVEVDENKHQDYECSCEHRRLMEISLDLNHRPIIFIRFNPDKYTDQNSNNVPSCWVVNSRTGVLYIPPKRRENWDMRMRVLKEQIQYWIDNPLDKTVEIVELFY
jgi:hypothetical protein